MIFIHKLATRVNLLTQLSIFDATLTQLFWVAETYKSLNFKCIYILMTQLTQLSRILVYRIEYYKKLKMTVSTNSKCESCVSCVIKLHKSLFINKLKSDATQKSCGSVKELRQKKFITKKY